MENVLKLNLKKDIFEKVRDENVRELTFESTPFYFSRFTNNKNNTIEGVKNDPTLFKRFDKVMFSCSGETLEYDYINTKVENDEFVLIFGQKIEILDEAPNGAEEETIGTEDVEEVESQQVEVELIVEEPVKEIETTIEIERVDDCVNEEETPETEHVQNISDVDKVLNDFYSKRRVYVVNKNIVIIGYGGVITCTGEKFVKNVVHNVRLKLNNVTLSIENLDNELSNLLDNNYVFINKNELKIVDGRIEVPIKTINVLEPLNWR